VATVFLDTRLAAQTAPAVGDILQFETGLDPDVQGFAKLAAQYRLDCKNATTQAPC
jgi:hypothetical protein